MITSKGKIRLFKQEITKCKTYEIARKVGYVVQNPSEMLFETSVFKECSFGPASLGMHDVYPKVRKTLFRLGLLKYADKDPHSLSGGEQRLLTLADILVNDPAVLLLDEPEFGLDLKTWKSFCKTIRNLKNEGKTIILTTHNLEATMFLCDRVALMNRGRMLKVDTPAMIYENSELLQTAGLKYIPIFHIIESVMNEIKTPY